MSERRRPWGIVGGIAVCALAGASQGAISADLDGDLRLDSILVSDGLITVEFATGATRIIKANGTLQSVADVDLDGRLDLIMSDGSFVFNDVISGSDDTPEGPPVFDVVWDSSATTLENATRHIVYDFDGDGREELVTANYNGPLGSDVATLTIFERQPDDTWVETWCFSDGPRIFTAMVAADVEGNTSTELVVGKIGGSYLGGPFVPPRVYIFKSTGDDSYELDFTIDVVPGVQSYTLLDQLAVGDADGNNAPDIIVGLADNETALNPTWGSHVRGFTKNPLCNCFDLTLDHVQSNTGIGYLTALDVGDSDDDGFGEVVFFERIIPNIHRLEHNGSAFVKKTAPSGVAAGVCSDVDITDVRGDGDVGLLAGGASGGDGHVYLFESVANDVYGLSYQDDAGLGNTVLYVASDDADPPNLAGGAHSAEAIVLVYDADLDDLDVVTSFAIPDAIQVHEVSVGSFDGDCGLDLMVTRFNGSSISGVYEEREGPGISTSADLDCDGEVGVLDLLDLLGMWGACPGCPADLDGDDEVGVLDLLILLGAWG